MFVEQTERAVTAHGGVFDDEVLIRVHAELDAPLPTEQTPEQIERERRRRIAMENESAIGGAAGMLTMPGSGA